LTLVAVCLSTSLTHPHIVPVQVRPAYLSLLKVDVIIGIRLLVSLPPLHSWSKPIGCALFRQTRPRYVPAFASQAMQPMLKSHRSGRWSVIVVTFSIRTSFRPWNGCPACPPLRFPVSGRIVGFGFDSASDDGGFDEFCDDVRSFSSA